nr:EOG090X02VY [Eulimnadia texana]
MDQKKCYLFGRNPQMNDFCIDHASCSRVHAALVWHKHLQRAFLVDLGSTHGTFIGSLRIESHKPTQLPIDSIFHFGASTREYVIRERPQTTSRSILEELEEESKTEHQDGGLLGLPESEIELQNLTEFNTAHNRRITMLGIADEDARAGPRKRKKHNVSFKDEEDIINPEDVDPSVGRFRNLIQTTVIPVKKMKANTGDALTPESRRQRTNSASSDEETKSHTGHSSLLFASSLSSKLGLPLLPNPAPDVDLAPPVEQSVPQTELYFGVIDEHEPKKKKVSECQQRVNDLLDLQLCREGVITAMRTEDYEKAAAHVHRFLAMDENLLKLTAGDVAQGTNVDSTLLLLHEARNQLCEVVRLKFDEAVSGGDVASVERFFKIFPLLNMHEEGLKKFALHLATQLRETAQKNLRQTLNTESTHKRAAVMFADTLTLLLEGVARIVEIHHPLVETYYGPGRLLNVMEILQVECDTQATSILQEFRKARQFEKKVRSITDLVTSKSNLETKCDPRELDSLLVELALISARTELYLRFVRRRIGSDLEIGLATEKLRQEKMNHLEELLRSKNSLSRTVQTALNNVEASIECVETLHKSLEGEVTAALGASLASRDREKIQSCSSGFGSLVAKFRSLTELGLQQLRSSAVKPRIKPWIDEFLSVEHDIDEEEYASYEAQDPFVQELIVHLDGFISSFKTALMPNSYEALVSLLTNEVAQQMEKVVLKTKFSRLGGMQFDKELRALIAYLSSATTWTVRDRFARLTQIATLLNLDKLSEISEYWGANSGPITWRLTPSEVRQMSSSIFIQKVNPVTGRMEWEIQREDYDYTQEVARAAFADMLHDFERNAKYHQALKKAVDKLRSAGKPVHVLDIGTGTSLLAMMGAKYGADSVTACETFKPMAECAKKVMRRNQLDDKIKLVPKRSTEMEVGPSKDMEQRANILITEVFDTELIGEGAIGTFNHAHNTLLSEDSVVIPARATIYIQLIESPLALRWNKLLPIVLPNGEIVKPPANIANCHGSGALHDVQLAQFKESLFKPLSDPIPAFHFDWNSKTATPFDEQQVIQVKTINPGTVHALLMWWDLDMDTDGEIVLSCAPPWAHPDCSENAKIPWRDHWMQAIFPLPSEFPVTSAGETVDGCLLGPIAAKLGARKVFSVETNPHCKRLVEAYVKENSLEGTIKVVDDISLIDEKVDVIAGEPAFQTSILPWHNLYFWYSKENLREKMSENCQIIPGWAEIWAVPVQFEDLWKIRAPVGSTEGFDLQDFDALIQTAIDATDDMVEPHPLWEYPCTALGEPFRLMSLDITESPGKENLQFAGTSSLAFDGNCNGIAIWIDWNLHKDTTVSTGPVETIVPGKLVEWDIHSKQGVYLLKNPQNVQSGQQLRYEVCFSPESGNFKFEFLL